MKIVLPLAGKGTRLLPHTQNIPKPLMEIAGKSILAHLMDELVPLQPKEFVFIVGHLKEQIITFVNSSYPNIQVRFVEQSNPQGLGHAIYQAKDAFPQDDAMLVILGDQSFTIDWQKMLNNSALGIEGLVNRLSIFSVLDASSFGVVLTDNQGKVLEMEEKPQHPKANTIISGTYYFQSAHKVFSCLEKQIQQDIRTRGEIQITDTMRLMMQDGEEFTTLPISDWNDCGNHEDLIKANNTLISKKNLDSQQSGVYISTSAIVCDCQLGNNVSIGDGAKVSGCVLTDTVICSGVQVDQCTLKESYITQDISNRSEQKLYL